MNDLRPDTFARRELLLVPEQLMRKDGCVRGHAVLVRDGRFARVGPADALRAEFPQLAAIELPQRLLMPGLIDAHTHLTQS